MTSYDGPTTTKPKLELKILPPLYKAQQINSTERNFQTNRAPVFEDEDCLNLSLAPLDINFTNRMAKTDEVWLIGMKEALLIWIPIVFG